MAGSKSGKRKRRGGKGRRRKNHNLLAAIGHPLRRRILRLMSDDRKASPADLAKTLNEQLSLVAYHVRVLAKFGALKRVSKRKTGGGTQSFYRRSEMPDWVLVILEEDERLP